MHQLSQSIYTTPVNCAFVHAADETERRRLLPSEQPAPNVTTREMTRGACDSRRLLLADGNALVNSRSSLSAPGVINPSEFMPGQGSVRWRIVPGAAQRDERRACVPDAGNEHLRNGRRTLRRWLAFCYGGAVIDCAGGQRRSRQKRQGQAIRGRGIEDRG